MDIFSKYFKVYMRNLLKYNRQNLLKNVTSLKIGRVWINKMKANEYNPQHIHSGDLSFVMYLSVPDDLKKEREKEHRHHNRGSITFKYGEHNPTDKYSYFATQQNFLPEERRFFYISCQLTHQVIPFSSDIQEQVLQEMFIFKMIVFKKIRYRNFLSTGNTPIEVDLRKSPTTLIIGQNGSGKSTLLDALCWALFNKPFRIIKKEQMINTINSSDCEVEIEFDVGTKQYRVKRSVKPNLFEIYENGNLLNQNASSIDYQKYLEQNIMKLNYRSFIQVVILGSSSYEPFMKMKARYRRDVVEEILDVKVFTQMDLILRDQQGQLSKEVLEMRHKCDLIQTKYETEMKHFKSLSDLNTNDIDDKKLQLEKHNKAKEEYTNKIKEIQSQIDDYNTQLEGKDEGR